MGLLAYLIPHQSVLNQTHTSSFWGFAKVKGNFEGYDAKFEVAVMRGTEFSLEGWRVFYRIKLGQKVRAPFFVWDKCPIEGYENVALLSRRWLTISDFIRYPFFSFSAIKLDSYFNSQSNESVRNKFLRLVEVAHKIENNQIDFVKTFEKERKKFIRNIFIAIIILVAWYGLYIIIGILL